MKVREIKRIFIPLKIFVEDYKQPTTPYRWAEKKGSWNDTRGGKLGTQEFIDKHAEVCFHHTKAKDLPPDPFIFMCCDGCYPCCQKCPQCEERIYIKKWKAHMSKGCYDWCEKRKEV